MVIEPPCPWNENDYCYDAEPSNLTDAGRGSAEAVSDVDQKQNGDVRDEGVMADTVAGASGCHIEPDADGEHEEFHRHGSGDGVPEAEPELWAAGVERHVGAMGDPVENPMAYYADPDCNGSGPVA